MEKLGIEKLKKDVVVIAKIIGKADRALEDKKITITEWVGLALDVPALVKSINNYKDSVAELMDLSEAEAKELSDHVAKELELRNDHAEVIVEQIIEVILTLTVAALALKDAKEDA